MGLELRRQLIYDGNRTRYRTVSWFILIALTVSAIGNCYMLWLNLR